MNQNIARGTLRYDSDQDRLYVESEHGTHYFHCGEPLTVCESNSCKSTRIEYSHDKEAWYLAGLFRAGEIPQDLQVKYYE